MIDIDTILLPSFEMELEDCKRARALYRDQLEAGLGLADPTGLHNAEEVSAFRAWLRSLSDPALDCVLMEAIEQSRGMARA